jgi:hypothetical protein
MRNRAIFANEVKSSREVVDEIKVTSWKWGLSRLNLPACLFYEWSWDPGDCLTGLVCAVSVSSSV